MAIQKASAASSNYLSTPSSAFNNPQGDFCLMFWLNVSTVTTTSGTYRSVMGTYNTTTGWEVNLHGNGTSARVQLEVTGVAASYNSQEANVAVVANEWHHYAINYQFGAAAGSRMTFYVDGTPVSAVADATANTNIVNAAAPLRIGQDADSATSFAGSLAYLRMFGGLLSQGEILAEMRSTTVTNRRVSTTFDYPLEASGGSNVFAVDRGPNRLHATAKTGTVSWDAGPRLPKRETVQLLQQDPYLFAMAPTGGVAGDVASSLTLASSSAASVGKVTDSAPALTIASSSTAGVGKVAAAAIALGVGVAASATVGVAGITGDVSAPLTVASSSSATVGKAASSTPALTVGTSSSATVGASSGSAPSLAVGSTSTAVVGKAASVSPALSVGVTATASVTSAGAIAASPTLTVGSAATATVGKPSGVTAPLGVTVTTTAVRGVSGATSIPLSLGVTASASVAAAGLSASTAPALTVGSASTAIRGVSSGATAPLTVAAAVSASVGRSAGTTAPLAVGVVASASVTSANDGTPVDHPRMALTVPGAALALNDTGTLALDQHSATLALNDTSRLALSSPDSRLELT